jgi:hypothetical protein
MNNVGSVRLLRACKVDDYMDIVTNDGNYVLSALLWTVHSCGLYGHVICLQPEVSEKYITSIFRVGK